MVDVDDDMLVCVYRKCVFGYRVRSCLIVMLLMWVWRNRFFLVLSLVKCLMVELFVLVVFRWNLLMFW